jgi:hypothetical protein
LLLSSAPQSEPISSVGQNYRAFANHCKCYVTSAKIEVGTRAEVSNNWFITGPL